MTDTALPLYERMYELTMRVDKIVYLPTCGGGDADSDLIEWMLESAADVLAPLVGLEDRDALIKAVEQYGDGSNEVQEAFGELFAWKNPQGWLIEGSQPVFTKYGKALGFSWGYYETKIFHGESFEAALDQAMKWAEENRSAVAEENEA